MGLQSLNTLLELAKKEQPKKLVVAAAEDHHVLDAVKKATKLGIVEPVLTGQKDQIQEIAVSIQFDVSNIQIVHVNDPLAASKKAVEIIRSGDASILMKGLVSTGPLLKAVLDKENGLKKSKVLSHIALFESPHYHKLLAVTDAAMNVAPDLNEKIAMLQNAVELFHKLGIAKPKVAVVGAVETVNPKMEATVHAALMTIMNQRGQIKGCIVEGPLAIDNAVSKEAAKLKKLSGEVAGDADIILTPDINAGNILYKSLNFLGGAVSAAVIMGASVPVVLTSRADSEKSKLMSIALAAAME